jgi:type 1 glutamine amidotransferase
MNLRRSTGLRFVPLLTAFAVSLASMSSIASDAPAAKPIKALLVTGGGYHDYKEQKKILPEGISARANVEWTVVHETSTNDGYKIPLYENPDWAEGYDVVVHNECYANVDDPKYVAKILNAHKNGTPAIVMHCAMHTYRSLKSDEYREFLGVSTYNHGKQHPLDVKDLQPTHPIMKGFPEKWVTGNEELYQINKVWPGVTVLAEAKAEDGNKRENAVIWAHTYGKGKVFGTTLAHNNKTMSDPVFLDLFTRGLLWSCDKLEEDGKPKSGYGPTTTAKTD